MGPKMHSNPHIETTGYLANESALYPKDAITPSLISYLTIQCRKPYYHFSAQKSFLHDYLQSWLKEIDYRTVSLPVEGGNEGKSPKMDQPKNDPKTMLSAQTGGSTPIKQRMGSAFAEMETPVSKTLGSEFSQLDFASAVKTKGLESAFNFDEFDHETSEELMEEPLLRENKKRFVLFPIQYNKIWNAYKNCEAKFWSAEEIEFSDDVDDWSKVPPKERACLMHALAVLSVNDLLAGDEPIISKLSDEIQSPEARCYFGFHIMQKNIHTETLNVLLDAFARSAEDKEFLFNAVEAMPTTAKRTAWVQKHITESPCSYSTRLFAFAAYTALMNLSAQSVLLHICADKTSASKLAQASGGGSGGHKGAHGFAGLQHALIKIHADMTRCLQFLRVLACEHFVNPIHAAEARTMVAEAVRIEREVCLEVLEMGGAGSGKKGGVEVCGAFVDAGAVGRRVERVGEKLLEMFGVKAAGDNAVAAARGQIGQRKGEGDSLEWMDAFMWAAVAHDSGVVEHVAVKEVKEKAPEKMSAKQQEFTLDEDF